MSLFYYIPILDSTCHTLSEITIQEKMVKIKLKHDNFLKIIFGHHIQIR